MPLLVVTGSACAATAQLTGTHFPATGDFQILKMLGYDFAVVVVDTNRPSSWATDLDAGQAAGLKLIIGAYPPPYQYLNGGWSITPAGNQFLSYLQSRSSLVMALYVFNEPYSTNPYTGAVTPCGYYSAGDLRALRATIQSAWPGLKIYHDLGAPSEWAPGAPYNQAEPCVGSKYSDQTGVADYVGIWYDPFRTIGFERSRGLTVITQEANYVVNSMQPAQPIALNQAFACPSCEEPGLVFPTPAQLLDWNCATRALPVAGLAWYPWQKFSAYTQAIGEKPAYWPLSTAGACRPGVGADAIGVSSATGMPFVAPNSLVSIYGSGLGFGSVSVQDSAGNRSNASTLYTSQNQINFVMPASAVSGQAAIAVSAGGGQILGTTLVSNVAPAIFTADGTGSGVAAATAVRISGDQVTVLTAFQCGVICSALPLDLSSGGSVYMSLYATGIRNHKGPVSVLINGTTAPVVYAGAQGQYDGLDQINIGPLQGFGGQVTILISVDGQTSNPVTAVFR